MVLLMPASECKDRHGRDAVDAKPIEVNDRKPPRAEN